MRIHIIVGPTASGKTSAAHKLAEHFSAPIINADAYQIYKDMNIGTNKVSEYSPFFEKYHLLNIVSPDQNFDVKSYQTLFRNKIEELRKDNVNDVVVVGGNGLYIRASIYDYEFPDEEETDTSEYDSWSNEEIYNELNKLDPKALETIHINNRKRLIRALSIAKSGNTKTDIIAKQNHEYFFKDDEIKIYFINPNREELYENINIRVDQMFDDGLLEEVENLLENYNLSTTAKAAIGYKETIDYIEGKISLSECLELIKKRTRNYAKRQVTFFKHQFITAEYSSWNDLVKKVIKNED